MSGINDSEGLPEISKEEQARLKKEAAKLSREQFFKTIRENTVNAPQATWFELFAWIKAGSSDKTTLNGINDLLTSRTVSRAYVSSVSQAERAFTVPVHRFIQRHNSDTGFWSAIGRYFSYVWIDATATSGLASMLYISSLKNNDFKISKWNILYYPILVALPGFLLKLVLSAVSAVAIPIILGITVATAAMGIVAMVPTALTALPIYLLGYRDTAKSMLSKVGSVFRTAIGTLLGPVLGSVVGIIATVPMSNINPVRAVMSLTRTPYVSASVINRLNSSFEEKNKKLAEQEELDVRNASSDRTILQNIHKSKIPEITATFNVQGGLRTDLVTAEAKKISGSSNYIMERQSIAWGLGKAINKDLVFKIRSSDVTKKDIMATVKLENANNNVLKLQFTDNASEDEQIRIALSFTKMLQGISHAAASNTPIKLDLSNSNTKEEVILANVRGLNKGTSVTIVFVDTKQAGTSTGEDRISDEIEDQKPEIQDEDDTHNDDDLSEVEPIERTTSRRNALSVRSGPGADHNKV